MWRGRKPTIGHFHVFGSTCYILRDQAYKGKFDDQSDKGMLLNYSSNSKAFRIHNKHQKTFMESFNVVVKDEPTSILMHIKIEFSFTKDELK